MVEIRQELNEDKTHVADVLRRAFGQEDESLLVGDLREAGKMLVSLVAESDGNVVECIVFSPVSIEDGDVVHDGLALGPVAVLPGFQGLGIGTLLINEGLKVCRQEGHRRLFVLGHPGYYPKFGFVPASHFAVRCIYDVPDDVFMAIELEKGAFNGVQGVVKYSSEFDSHA